MSPRRRIADAIRQLVHDQPVLIGQGRRHALALDAGHLEAEGHDQGGVDRGREQRLDPRHELVAHLRRVNEGSARRGRVSRSGPRPPAHTPDVRLRVRRRVLVRAALARHEPRLAGTSSANACRSCRLVLDSAALTPSAVHGARSAARSRLQFQVIPEPTRLRPADGNLRGLRVLHPQDVIPAEPGDYLLDFVDVHQVRPVNAPESRGIEPGLQFVERPEVARAADLACHNINRLVRPSRQI